VVHKSPLQFIPLVGILGSTQIENVFVALELVGGITLLYAKKVGWHLVKR
jgi:hypothetical protein